MIAAGRRRVHPADRRGLGLREVMAGCGHLLVLALCAASALTALTAVVDPRAHPALTHMDILMRGAHPSKVGAAQLRPQYQHGLS